MTLLEALGNARRLKIIRELSREPKYVSELAESVGMNGKSAVHHLGVLEEAGLVDHYRRGNRKYYRLVSDVELYAAPPPERTFILQTREQSDESA
ncbi:MULTISPECIES: ArsR/SmtB family transcription factor [Natronococcus]|uniref:ArsR family transcriptional regulator n=1 Tax=Natronococcus amylolyticus DSM 10524 TaxID=1227497 RepID=L9X0C9_9EURY|nr:metalloregulator ArsR/SmtB family transcription factor [Natronococcus amylolyticus]ELY55175.1 ArsR family transcriptional regulator [Natronococcus amylolyticus DSM 10524]